MLCSHDGALAILPLLLDAESDSRSFGKRLVDAAVPHCGALQVSHGTYPPGHLKALVVGDVGFLLALLAASYRRGALLLLAVALLAEIALQGHKDQLHARTVVGNLTHPLGLNVFEGVFAID